MDQRLFSIIQQRQLTSVMNQTKWQQLVRELSSSDTFEPQIRYKTIQSPQLYGFSHVWWDELLQIAASIEWLDINPQKSEYLGRLLPCKLTDYSAETEAAIRRANVPFTREEHYFRIWGYITDGKVFIT